MGEPRDFRDERHRPLYVRTIHIVHSISPETIILLQGLNGEVLAAIKGLSVQMTQKMEEYKVALAAHNKRVDDFVAAVVTNKIDRAVIIAEAVAKAEADEDVDIAKLSADLAVEDAKVPDASTIAAPPVVPPVEPPPVVPVPDPATPLVV